MVAQKTQDMQEMVKQYFFDMNKEGDWYKTEEYILAPKPDLEGMEE